VLNQTIIAAVLATSAMALGIEQAIAREVAAFPEPTDRCEQAKDCDPEAKNQRDYVIAQHLANRDRAKL
jgi:hypothetical protein